MEIRPKDDNNVSRINGKVTAPTSWYGEDLETFLDLLLMVFCLEMF